MEGLCCGEEDICIHMYVLTYVSHVSTHVTTRVQPPYKLVSLCRVFEACKLGDRQQGETRSEASSRGGLCFVEVQYDNMLPCVVGIWRGDQV